MRFGFVTLFPATIAAHMEDSVVGRAVGKGLIGWRVADPRDHAYDAHRKVDDTPYGGEPGMLMKAEPVAQALASLLKERGTGDGERVAVVVTEPGGRRFDQSVARELATFEQVVFVCGHYEGIDHRFEEEFATHVLSIGDFVLTGGELPALVMADAVARLVPGVLGSAESLGADSFDEPGRVSAQNYTRPPVWRGREVPPVLLSGDHAKVRAWREAQAAERTRNRS